MSGERRRILITGSSGQIGTNLGHRLLEMGYEVLGLDLRPNTWTQAFPSILFDLSDQRCRGSALLSQTIPEQIDLVVHLAASAKVYYSVCEPENACANVQMVHTILEYCRLHNLPLLFSSSREVYGNLPCDAFEETYADFTLATSPYAAGKIAAEAFIYSYSNCFGLRYLIARLSNVYGRYDCDLERMERVIPLFFSKIARGEPVTIYGREKLLDFTYIDDCVESLRRGIELLMKGKPVNQTINVARGQGHSLVDLVRIIGEEMGQSPQIHLRPSHAGEVIRYVADVSKAEEILGYRPTTTLRQGIKKSLNWWNSWNSIPSDLSSVTLQVGEGLSE